MAVNKEDIHFVYNEDTRVGEVKRKTDIIKEIYSEMPVPGFYKATERESIFSTIWDFVQFDVKLPNTAEATSRLIMDTKEIDDTFSKESIRVHEALGLSAHLGFILYGAHGTGKTTAMYSVANALIEKYGAMVIQVTNTADLKATFYHINVLRILNPDLMVVAIMDECEYQMQHNEDTMKLLLDSKETPSNFIFIGATNYFDRIPEAISKRPSRIKHTFDCSALNAEEEIVYGILQGMNSSLEVTDKFSEEATKELVLICVNKTIDEIKHIFVDAAVIRARTIGKPKTKKKSDLTTLKVEELN